MKSVKNLVDKHIFDYTMFGVELNFLPGYVRHEIMRGNPMRFNIKPVILSSLFGDEQ